MGYSIKENQRNKLIIPVTHVLQLASSEKISHDVQSQYEFEVSCVDFESRAYMRQLIYNRQMLQLNLADVEDNDQTYMHDGHVDGRHNINVPKL